MINKWYMDYLHLFVLVSFAIAQPIYDLLGKYPEFFVAHSAKPPLIISMILILSFGLAFVLVLAETLVSVLGERARRGVHLLLVFALAVLIALPLIKKLTTADILVVGFAGLAAFLFMAVYARLQAVRMFMTLLMPVVLIFPLWFVWTTPVGRLVFPQSERGQEEIQIKNPVPIVVVVFDEFTTTVLLDTNEQIDSVRFPNFASLAKDSWWFPNSTAAYFTTVQAIPAILTGKKPEPKKNLIPEVNNYPQNLFTLLEKKYSFNVFEPQTDMCPDDVCYRGDDDITQKYYPAVFADVVAIYIHLIAPPALEKKLPRFGGQWAGFGKFLIRSLKLEDESVGSGSRLKGWEKREVQIERFLSRIGKKSNFGLHYFHILLPHVPYEFLSSGKKYNPGPNYPFPDGMTKNKETWVWSGEAPLILNSYHQYLHQVGYADQFLGRLIEKLKTAGIYDEALFIVTADHGVSFQRGSSQRLIDDRNSRDILQVPMLVKLPGQREGFISERFVSGIDLLPTIVDVLRAEVSWVMDGRSMVSQKENSRTEIEIPEIGVFKLDDIKGFPCLKWQVENFGENSSLEHIVTTGPYKELVGNELEKLQVGDVVTFQLKSEDLEYFKHVDLDSGFLPALFRANIEGADGRSLPVAIALNGKIRTTTKTSKWHENHNYFSVLLPLEAFKNGRNLIDVFVIEKKQDKLELRPVLVQDHQDSISLERLENGQESLLFADGRKVLVDMSRDNMDGYLDWLNLNEEMLIFTGWAADLVESQPASEILIFKGEKLVWQNKPANRRDDVVKAFNRPTLLHSGYRVSVPLIVFESNSGDISLIAISKDKRSFRIQIRGPHKKFLKKMQKE
jgi:hypothetical protein